MEGQSTKERDKDSEYTLVYTENGVEGEEREGEGEGEREREGEGEGEGGRKGEGEGEGGRKGTIWMSISSFRHYLVKKLIDLNKQQQLKQLVRYCNIYYYYYY